MAAQAWSRRHILKGTAGSLVAGLVARAGADDDPVPPIDERIRRLAENAPLAMRFDGDTAEACRAWQRRFAETLRIASPDYS